MTPLITEGGKKKERKIETEPRQTVADPMESTNKKQTHSNENTNNNRIEGGQVGLLN